MRFIRQFFWVLYPICGAAFGAWFTWQCSGDLESGFVDGGVLGITAGIWYEIRRWRHPKW